MTIVWTSVAWADVSRLYAFLVQHDLDAADAVFDRLVEAPEALLDFPRRGRSIGNYSPREVREFSVGRYRMRYEVTASQIMVLRFFHGREDRGS